MNLLYQILLKLNQSQNIFVSFLRLLNVRHTNLYGNQYYNGHPDKYNFFGLSRMLSEYKVENVGVQIKNKKQSLEKLDVPFIAHVGSELVIVNEKTDVDIHYLWRDKQISVTLDKFLDIWSGAVLVAEADENSGEPNYDFNRKQELMLIVKRCIIVFTILIMLIYFQGVSENGIAGYLLLLINLTGGIVAGLLLLKQLKVQGKYIDNICSLLLPHSDCNSMLDGNASKLFNLVSWSEIGFGYFASNIFIMLFIPDLFYFIPILNLCTLPYTLWSVWYQKFVAKQWCALCLIVQLLLWGIFLVSLFGGLILPVNDWWKIPITGCFYVFFVLSVNMTIHFLSKLIKNENVSYELKSLKSNETVFLSLLKKETYFSEYKTHSNILFGNLHAKNVITVVTNPHCNPCAKLHAEMKLALENNDFCIQYVFTSFGEEFDDSCLFLISVYQNYKHAEFEEILSKWFEYGKLYRALFFDKYSIDIKNDLVCSEYNLHKKMLDKLDIITTPSLFFNGYKLPEMYKIEDLKCFLY